MGRKVGTVNLASVDKETSVSVSVVDNGVGPELCVEQMHGPVRDVVFAPITKDSLKRIGNMLLSASGDKSFSASTKSLEVLDYEMPSTDQSKPKRRKRKSKTNTDCVPEVKDVVLKEAETVKTENVV